ncbi:hypothetical protein [Solicola sp. PLA-1-18]|uniref:hypothetical protein n=1 Tax=Solicola sp. PLA-1-18 TaxID=3380532 RepID=UPI003B8118FC
MTSISDLPGLAPRRPVTESPTPAEEVTPQSTSGPDPATSQAPSATPPVTKRGSDPTAPATRRTSNTRTPRKATDTPIRESSFLAPADVRDRLRAHATATGQTLAQIVLTAVETTAEQLPDLIATERGTAASPLKGSLFPATEGRGRRRAPGQAHVTISMRINAANLDVLDQLTAQVGAGSRSELLSVALAAYLDTVPRA